MNIAQTGVADVTDVETGGSYCRCRRSCTGNFLKTDKKVQASQQRNYTVHNLQAASTVACRMGQCLSDNTCRGHGSLVC